MRMHEKITVRIVLQRRSNAVHVRNRAAAGFSADKFLRISGYSKEAAELLGCKKASGWKAYTRPAHAANESHGSFEWVI